MLGAVTAIVVRPVRADNLDALVTSVDGLFQEDGGRHDPFMDGTWPAREGRAYYAGLLGDPNCLLLLAFDGDTAVGHLVGKLAGPDSLRLARVAVLESLRVRPQHRGHGVGGLLVAEFFAWARQHEAGEAVVTAFAANDGARRFYARHGFTAKSVTMRAPMR
jgi:GNAT superfamily N-acetyltransferase